MVSRDFVCVSLDSIKSFVDVVNGIIVDKGFNIDIFVARTFGILMVMGQYR